MSKGSIKSKIKRGQKHFIKEQDGNKTQAAETYV
jgi:hypothetical protein